MADSITVLETADVSELGKVFAGIELTPHAFRVASLFNITEEPISDLQSLSKVLQRLENDLTRTIIRGSLIEGKTNNISRKKETFAATARQWCMIDIDSLAWDGDINDHRAMLAHAIKQLPADFQSVDCWYHFSSSMGIKAFVLPKLGSAAPFFLCGAQRNAKTSYK